MYGAILGDIIGAPYEFDAHNIKTKDFPLFSKRSEFTDDSIMTLAVAEALMNCGENASDEEVKAAIVAAMQKYGRKYPGAGYGMNFSIWLNKKDPKPYNSFGNGSAMRVSSVPWLYQYDFGKMLHMAELSAVVTHNHPEGVKGALATAAAIFLALHKQPKEVIKGFIEKQFGYDLSRTCDEIRPNYHMVESCQETVPEAITAFLEGENFEDVIRLAVSLGGDSDTLTAIAGSIAEAFYGVPEELKVEARERLSDDLRDVLIRFDEKIAGDIIERGKDKALQEKWDNVLSPVKPQKKGPDFSRNVDLEAKMAIRAKGVTQQNSIACLEAIRALMNSKGLFMIPVMPMRSANAVKGQPVRQIQIQVVKSKDGRNWQVAYTSDKAYSESKLKKGPVMALPVSELLGQYTKKVPGANKAPEEIVGIVLNPDHNAMFLPRNIIEEIFKVNQSAEVASKNSTVVITRGDITKIKADCAVNSTNGALTTGGGVNGAIHEAAGAALDAACEAAGECMVGEVKITEGFDLPSKYIIHTVGPFYDGTPVSAASLVNCYKNSLDLARKIDIHTIMFPNISTGQMGYPKDEACDLALEAVEQWIVNNKDYVMHIVFVCHNEENYALYNERAKSKMGNKKS